MNGRILTCVYCGHEYPQDTKASGSQVLTDHIRVCEKHPMRKAEDDIAMLRAALAGLIGAEAEDELRQMEVIMPMTTAPEEDKAVAINAIRALLATMPPNATSHRGAACGVSPGRSVRSLCYGQQEKR